MKPRVSRWLGSIALLLAAGLVPVTASAESAAELLPATTVVYGKIPQPSALVDAIRNHPLGKTLQSLPEYEPMIQKNPEINKARAGVLLFEFVVQRKWHEAIRDLAGDGLYFAVDGPTQGAIALAHAPDEKKLIELYDRLIKAARDDAKRKGNKDLFEEHEYRGHKFYKTDQAFVGTLGKWLIVTNKAELGRVVVDNLFDGGKDVLSEQPDFQAARKVIVGEPAVWAYAHNKTLREADVAKEIYKGTRDNPGAELLVGGISAALINSNTSTMAVYLEVDRLRVALNISHEPADIAEQKEFYFGKDGQGAAPLALVPKNKLFAISSYRDIGEMWRRRSDLFSEDANVGLTQADANFSSLFAGMDFGREVLGALKPQVQIVSAKQNFDDLETPAPKVKLPAAALVFELKDPEKMQRQLKVSFQSLIGLTNLGAGQNGLPQLELQTENTKSGQLISAAYDSSADASEVSNDIIYNFSPTLGFVGDNFIVSSTRELASELMNLAAGESTTQPDSERVINTRLTLDSQVLRELLETNREALIAQNMLDKGHSREKAEQEIGGLIALLKLFGETSLELIPSNNSLQLDLSLKFAK